MFLIDDVVSYRIV